MNICYVCNEYPEGPHGGVGTMTQLLAEELSARGNSVRVIGVYDMSYPAPVFEMRNGVEITRIKVNFRNKVAVIWGNYMAAMKIRAWIHKDYVDVIEASDSYGVFSLFAAFKRPLILRANGNNTYFASILNIPVRKNTAFYERNLYKKAFGFCAVSEFTAARMKKLYNLNKPITVIYNAVEMYPDQSVNPILTSKASDLSGYKNPVVFSGTLTPKKGIYELVNALIVLLKKRIALTLIINGKDSINIKTGESVKKELLKLIPDNMIDNFVFNGHVTRFELISQYKQAKAAIFPSYAEAFAFAPMEAMAAGTPTVFSKECSGEELIKDKIDGLLIDPYSVESIANAIEYLINNPENAFQMAQKGKEKIMLQFSKEAMTTKTLEFYNQIIKEYYIN